MGKERINVERRVGNGWLRGEGTLAGPKRSGKSDEPDPVIPFLIARKALGPSTRSPLKNHDWYSHVVKLGEIGCAYFPENICPDLGKYFMVLRNTRMN